MLGKDKPYMSPTNEEELVSNWKDPEVFVAWYNMSTEDLEPYQEAGRRTMGHVTVSAHIGKPIRVRAIYDPFAPFNFITNEILSPIDQSTRGGLLPAGFAQAIQNRKEVYLQMPWRCDEFTTCIEYIRLDVQIQRGRWINLVPFMVNSERQTSVVFGRGFCRRFFHRVRDEDTLILRDPSCRDFEYEIMSTERVGFGRSHVYTEELLEKESENPRNPESG